LTNKSFNIATVSEAPLQCRLINRNIFTSGIMKWRYPTFHIFLALCRQTKKPYTLSF